MAKGNGYAPPLPLRKLLQVDSWQMMGVHDEAIHADFQEMIHRVGNDGTSSNLQQWLGTSLRERTKSHSQTGCQDKGCLESSFLQ